MARRLLWALLAVIALATGCSGKHRATSPTASTHSGYSLRDVKRAFAEQGLPLSVLASNAGTVLLGVRSLAYLLPTDDFTVTYWSPARVSGVRYVVQESGRRLIWSRNLVVALAPASPSAPKVRAAVARLEKLPKTG